MKNRTIDVALIVGLVLVAGAIVWTLFSLGGTPRGSLPDAGPTVRDGAAGAGGSGDSDGGGVVPVDPNDGAALDGDALPNGGVAPLAPGDLQDGDRPAGGEAPSNASSTTPVDAAASATDENAETTGGEPDDQGPDVRVPAAQAPPVPASGPVELGRVGFSFVTGGAGACGIVLEPWTHVAVSRELLEAYGCGAEVTVTLDDATDGRTEVQAIVADTMNPSFSRTLNMYVGEDEPALAYGLTSGTVAPR